MEIKRKFGVLLLTVLAAAWPASPPAPEPKSAAAPRLDAWRVLGPGGGGAMYFPTISPHDERVVLLRCDMGGAYLTLDGGESWRMFNLRGTVAFFDHDPQDANVMYAATIALWRSADRGKTWRMAYPPAAEVERIESEGDHASEGVLLKGGGRPQMDAMAIDPADSKRIYLAIHESRGAASIQRSLDGGATWTQFAALPEPARKLWVAVGSRKLIAATKAAVLVEEAAGKLASHPTPAALVDVSAGFDAAGQARIYATTEGGMHYSTDFGASWQSAKFGTQGTQFPAVATSREHPLTAYVSFTEGRRGDRAFGVAKTTDGGATWTPVWRDTPNTAAPNVRDAWINERFGPTWGDFPLTLGVSPRNPHLVYSTDLGRTMRSTDGGQSWQAVYSRRASGGWTSTGLDVTTSYGIHFDPHAPQRMFIDFTDIGLFRSEDGGSTWLASSEGMPDRWVNTAYAMEFDPKVKARVWVALSGTHDLPRPKMWRRTPIARYRGGVAESSDGGKTWKVVSENLPQGAATHLWLDPKSPVEARTLYVTMFGRGVYKSTDGGKTWTLKNTGIEGAEPFAWRLTPSLKDGALWLVVARRSEDGGAGNAGDGALYRSTDGAEHWTRVPLPAGVNGPNALTVDAEDPQRLYLSLWGRAARPVNRDGGVLLSTDGGRTWKPSLERDQNIYDVTQDPRHPKVLYACGFNSSIWRSEDKGATWRRLRGYNFKWGHRVVVDPFREGRIFVNTFGGGIWYGPANGDPRAAEDIVSPEARLP
jgi:photosystem II stability/assembly factor-like uncharacterized protein